MMTMRRLLQHLSQGFAAVLAGVCLCLFLAPAQAVCTSGACVSAGPRLASVDSKRGTLLNAVLGALGNSSLSLTAFDWNAIASGNVDLVRTLTALQATVNASSTQAALLANVSVADVVNAAAAAATQENKNGLAAALNKLALQLGGASQTIRLGDIVTSSGVVGATQVNALDLVTGAIQLYNKQNVATTGQTPITVSGLDLGIASLASVKLWAQVIEPPVFVCGGTGSTFHSAALRVRLDMQLVNVSLDVSALTTLGLNIAVSVGNLSVYAEVAQADGAIGTINAVSNAMSVNVTPGIAKLYLGQIDPTVFFNRARPLVAGDVTWGTIGAVTLGTDTLAVQAKAFAIGTTSATRVLNFSAGGGYPQTQTAVSSTTSLLGLLSTLVGNLQVQIPGLNAGLLTGTVNSTVSALVATLLQVTLLPSLLTDLVDPLLGQLGVHIGEVDVNAGGRYSLCPVTGCVYDDGNHNLRQDGGEAGTGTALYAKLIDPRVPDGDALAAVAVNASTGLYAFPGRGAGNYRIVVNGDSNLANKTPAAPAGWIATEMPTLTREVSVQSVDVPLQNFGLYHGSKLTGTVFKDNGIGGGTANNGVRDGAEASIVASTVKATDVTGTLVHDSATTGDNGTYTLWLPFSTNGAAVKVTQPAPTEWTSVSGSAGTTGGSYARITDTVSFTHASGSLYTGVDFGDVPVNLFVNDGQQTIQPAHVAFFPHAFTAGSAGSLSLALSAPPIEGWSATAYSDGNCNGVIDGADALLGTPLPMTADQKACIVLRVFAPATAAINSQYPVTLTATFAYANAGFSVNHQRGDLTVIGTATDSGLRLIKVVDKNSALPGEVLTYTITYLNQSDKGLTALKVMDATPAYTVFASASCGQAPNAAIVCAVGSQPAAGGAGRIEWTFSGTLTPGTSGTVLFAVTVQ